MDLGHGLIVPVVIRVTPVIRVGSQQGCRCTARPRRTVITSMSVVGPGNSRGELGWQCDGVPGGVEVEGPRQADRL
jgi:hypothetical protein